MDAYECKYECIKDFYDTKKGEIVEIFNKEIYPDIHGYDYFDLDCDFVVIKNKCYESGFELDTDDFFKCFKSTEKIRKQFLKEKPYETFVISKKSESSELEKGNYGTLFYIEEDQEWVLESRHGTKEWNITENDIFKNYEII